MARRQRMGGRWTCRGGAAGRLRASGLRLALLAGPVALAIGPSDGGAETFYFRDRAGVTHFTNVPTDSRYKALPAGRSSFSQVVWTPGTGTRRDGAANQALATPRPRRGVASDPPADLSAMISAAARRHSVEPALVHAVVRAESAFDQSAVSPDGAMGLMQLMPDTASLVGVRNAFHPVQNVEGGVYYLRMMLDRFAGNVPLALAAYNAGPGAVESYGGVPPYAETREYLERVFRYRQEYLRRTLERDRLALAVARAR